MDDKESAGVVTVLFGIVTLAVSLAPGCIGIGDTFDGNCQMVGAILSAAIFAVGLFLALTD